VLSPLGAVVANRGARRHGNTADKGDVAVDGRADGELGVEGRLAPVVAVGTRCVLPNKPN
jgi:hypothetical protein